MKPKIETVVLVADLAGTVVFALEGAVAAMKNGLDLLGVMVLSFVVALAGGVVCLAVRMLAVTYNWQLPRFAND